MNRRLLLGLVMCAFIFLNSCAKDEECVCVNSANITESDAKDNGVSLDTACELAKIGDESCKVE